MKLNKSISILILVIFLFSLLGSFVLSAERKLEVEYPKVGEEELPLKPTLPEYIKYIFKFSLIIAAVAAFAILIYGGFRYLTSAGSPEAIKDAKSWMFGGILGLVLLLCSYLILTTINPELISPKEPEVKPFVGIYLINAEGKKLYYIQDSPEIPKDFTPEKIVFISDKPADPDKRVADPDKLELDSIFIYPKKNWGGNPTKITNDGAWTTSSDSIISSLKSFKFLWHRPGIYLYKEETGWETDSWPLFLQSSSGYVGKDWNDKAKSLKIVNEDGSINLYNAVLFQHIHFNEGEAGKCSWVYQNTDSFDDRVQNDLSSIAIFKSGKLHGEVTFFDAIDCDDRTGKCVFRPPPIEEGVIGAFWEVFLTQTKPSSCPEGPGVDSWKSFSIGGNMAVLINTQEDRNGNCRLFHKLGCEKQLKGTEVYSSEPRYLPWLPGDVPNPRFYEPKIADIYPTME